MANSLIEAISSIKIDRIDESDKFELSQIFFNTKSALIRNHIAFMFSDMNYSDAIPVIIQKIKDKTLYNENGSLVFALKSMDTLPYFLDIIRIACEQGYEARMTAFEIIEKHVEAISDNIKIQALEILEKYRTAKTITNSTIEDTNR